MGRQIPIAERSVEARKEAITIGYAACDHAAWIPEASNLCQKFAWRILVFKYLKKRDDVKFCCMFPAFGYVVIERARDNFVQPELLACDLNTLAIQIDAVGFKAGCGETA